ncbi:MAG: tRNA pseudouridine(54/55) synthase Pus10 [Candidatus Bipolaricaulia bacterium]
MDELLRQAQALIASEALCDRCLGRCVAKRGTRLTNPQRGRALRVTLAMVDGQAPDAPETCSLCRGIFQTADEWAHRATEAIQDVEFSTYLFGTRIPSTIETAEAELWQRHGLTYRQAEPIKQEFNREVGRRFGSKLADCGRAVNVDFDEPQIAFLLDLPDERLDLTIHPLFVYGRYRKLVRGIPQTRWPCQRCRGRGCPDCNGAGKQYAESVEELIATPLVRASGGDDFSLHGAGREDIDARMLGAGRPFVLEVQAPKVRTLDLGALQAEINRDADGKVGVRELVRASRDTVQDIKELDARKRYRAWVQLREPISAAWLHRAVATLTDVDISQRTPTRVSHRRADVVRRRRVHDLSAELTDEREAVVELLGDGGLYVKEFISGDEGRSTPSLSEALGVGARVTALDVLEVDARPAIEMSA